MKTRSAAFIVLGLNLALSGVAAGAAYYFHSLETASLVAMLASAALCVFVGIAFGPYFGGITLLVLSGILIHRAFLVEPYTGPWLDTLLGATAALCAGGVAVFGDAVEKSRSERITSMAVAAVCLFLLGIGIAFLLEGDSFLPPLWLTVIAVAAAVAERVTGWTMDQSSAADRGSIMICAVLAVSGFFVAHQYPQLSANLSLTLNRMLHDYGWTAALFPALYCVCAILFVRTGFGWRYVVGGAFVFLFGLWSVWDVAIRAG